MVCAMAAPTPIGAKYITYFVYRNITSESDLQNSTTGAAFNPMAAHAAPNRNANTTICNTSPRAMASITLAGKGMFQRAGNRRVRLRQAPFPGS